MGELLLWCRCGWTKHATAQGGAEDRAWFRIFIHQLFRHRRDPAFWIEDDTKNGIQRIRTVT